MTTRREFIKLLGLTLASLVASGVVPACSTLSDAQHPAWNTIRQCWLSLGQGKSQEDVDRQKADYQAGPITRPQLTDYIFVVPVCTAGAESAARAEGMPRMWC
jgi:hypothetical protein